MRKQMCQITFTPSKRSYFSAKIWDSQLVEKPKDDDIDKVAGLVFEQTGCSNQIEPGYCLNCGTYRDLEALHAMANKAEICIRGLQDAIIANEVGPNTLSDALVSFDLLRSTLHAYNKNIAELWHMKHVYGYWYWCGTDMLIW
ncbi:hypothetical protein CsSME_00001246 [Camellia sinensis var. sinensis]